MRNATSDAYGGCLPELASFSVSRSPGAIMSSRHCRAVSMMLIDISMLRLLMISCLSQLTQAATHRQICQARACFARSGFGLCEMCLKRNPKYVRNTWSRKIQGKLKKMIKE